MLGVIPFLHCGRRRRRAVAAPDGAGRPARLAALGVFLLAAAALSVADAHGARTSITLDAVPKSVYEGQQVVFTGSMGSGGSPLYGAFVEICEDDPFVPDECLGSGTTDRQGRYTVTWTAKAALVEVDFDIYARFDGAGQYRSSQTPRQTMSVYEYSAGAQGAARDDSGTSLRLERVPSAVWVGDRAVFGGTLASTGGTPLSGRTVSICEDDPLWPDECLGSGTTDRQGRFAITWVADAATFETDFDIYAKFNGDSSYLKSQTARHTMSVYKHGGSLVLDPVPNRAAYGELVVLTGTLRLDRGSPENAIVYIKDEDFLNPDDLLASAFVDAAGRFETYWIVQRVDPDSTIDIQAVFEGGSAYYRIATPVQSLYAYNSTAPPPDPDPDPDPPRGDGYMELDHSKDYDRPPRVAIVSSPDSYFQVSRYIAQVQGGIQQLADMLAVEYPNGNWDVEFEVVEPGTSYVEREPDIVVHLVTRDEKSRCNDAYGWAQLAKIDQIQAHVCPLEHRNDAEIGATAAHEFIHAIGLGHTFNIPGDMMCSVEEDYGPTCPPSSHKSTLPSPLNLAAIAAVYGEDGFTNPNNPVSMGERFALNGDDGGSALAEVSVAAGSSVPGCERNNQCFIPYAVAIDAGGKVVWRNADNAAHTVTSGVLDGGGSDGLFDSGLMPPGSSFSLRFHEPGEYPYFCLVHPWRVGLVTVG